jgi:hypothetical protein
MEVLMGSKLIKLDNGIFVEVETPPDEIEKISAGGAPQVENRFRQLSELIKTVCAPIQEAHENLKQALTDTTEVEFGVSVEAGGNLFLVKSNASVKIKIHLKASS